MSNEGKEWLLKHVDYVFNECRICAEHHNYNCSECPKGGEACDQVRMELKRLIQQRSEIDDVWIKDKAREIALGGDFGHYMFSHRLKVFKKLITQIISDVRGDLK